jgi:flagellin-like hook-associated protein FlgL
VPPTPQVTFGRATGESIAPLINPVVRRDQLTLDQLIAKNDEPAPVLVIQELSGAESRQLVLGGRAKPFLGSLKFTGKMRTDKTPYTGFAKANQTVLGADQDDTEMNGEWHDRFLSDPDEVHAVLRQAVSSDEPGTIGMSRVEIRTARDLATLIDDFRLAGRQLRVSWAHLSYIGRIVEFEQDWQNLFDCKWRIKFEWIGPDDLTAGMPSPARTTLVGMTQAIAAGYQDMHAATNFDDLDGLRPSFADLIDRGVGAAAQTIEDLANTVETRISAVTDTIDAVRRGVTLASLVRDQAQDVIDSLNETTASAMLAIDTGDTVLKTIDKIRSEPESLQDLIGIDPGSAIAAACQQMGAVSAARELKHISARQRFNALRSLDTEVIAIVIMRDGQDLRDVAQRWYDSPSDWDVIRKFNGFRSSSVPVGTVVFVPALSQP